MAYTIDAKPRQQKTLHAIMRGAVCVTAGALGLLSLSACAPTDAVRGNLLQNYQLAVVQVGSDSQTDVMHELGTPTMVAPFDDKVWYYIGQDTKKYGPLDPKITKERVVRVTFGGDGKVAEVKDVTQARNDIPYSREQTPTTGNEITITQQFLGNIGRFNGAGETAGTTIGSDQGGGNGR